MKYSLIIPVYNRPDEVKELLESLTRQAFCNYEVIVVEDGSDIPCKDVCDTFADKLPLKYFYKENSGPGQSRNYGAERAEGEWLIILDSDVVLPDGYLLAVEKELQQAADAGDEVGAFGGPDASHPSFTPVQKAISYSMTSFFTTGGIRGGKAVDAENDTPKQQKRRALDKFYPRSYNMGIRREVYRELGGFSKMRFGEDIDFSYRIVEAGFRTALFPTAWVWHKRRTDLKKFFRQVYNSGIARINLEKKHPGTLKAVHAMPAVFTIGVAGLVLISAIGRVLMAYDDVDKWYWLCAAPWLPILLYAFLICVDATIRSRSLKVGFISIAAAFTQLTGYGCGFIEAWWKRIVKKQDEYHAFEKTFYK